MVNWIRLRQLLTDYRHRKPIEVKPLAALLKVAPSTIYRIENIVEKPDHEPALRNIAAWLDATNGMPLSEFFLHVEGGLQTVEAGKDNPLPLDLSPVVADDAPQLESEERIAQRVFRRLARLALEGLESRPEKRRADYRLPSGARPHAADSSVPARKSRRRHVPGQKKK